jgi:transposase
MKAMHRGNAKHDTLDAQNIAILLRGGRLPPASVYPREMRATRDLRRRRMHLVRQRAALLAHVQNPNRQYTLPEIGKKIAYKANRQGVAERFDPASIRTTITVDLALIDYYDALLHDLELSSVQMAKEHDANTFSRLRSIPGVGKSLALVRLYDIHDITRVPRVQEFVSYARLVTCPRASAGKCLGPAGAKSGNVPLKWVFAEAAGLFLRHNPAAQQYCTAVANQRAP